MNDKQKVLSRIGLFHIHVADKAGFCLLCGFLSRPERQGELLDFDFEYDDPYSAFSYEWELLKNWGYNYYTRRQLLKNECGYLYEDAGLL